MGGGGGGGSAPPPGTILGRYKISLVGEIQFFFCWPGQNLLQNSKWVLRTEEGCFFSNFWYFVSTHACLPCNAYMLYMCSQHAQHPLGGNCVDVLHMHVWAKKNGMTLHVCSYRNSLTSNHRL